MGITRAERWDTVRQCSSMTCSALPIRSIKKKTFDFLGSALLFQDESSVILFSVSLCERVGDEIIDPGREKEKGVRLLEKVNRLLK